MGVWACVLCVCVFGSSVCASVGLCCVWKPAVCGTLVSCGWCCCVGGLLFHKLTLVLQSAIPLVGVGWSVSCFLNE